MSTFRPLTTYPLLLKTRALEVATALVGVGLGVFLICCVGVAGVVLGGCGRLGVVGAGVATDVVRGVGDSD